MDIEYKGANAVKITTKKGTIVIDPILSGVGLKDVTVKNAVQLATTEDMLTAGGEKLAVSWPGEYEVADISIKGVAAVRHIDTDGKKATMYAIDAGGIRIGVTGHVRADLSEKQLEELGTLDILIIPVGGGGFTLDATEASTLTRQIAPKVVIPTHYADDALKYEVPQTSLEQFLKELGAGYEKVAKLKVKNGTLPDNLTIVEVTRSS